MSNSTHTSNICTRFLLITAGENEDAEKHKGAVSLGQFSWFGSHEPKASESRHQPSPLMTYIHAYKQEITRHAKLYRVGASEITLFVTNKRLLKKVAVRLNIIRFFASLPLIDHSFSSAPYLFILIPLPIPPCNRLHMMSLSRLPHIWHR